MPKSVVEIWADSDFGYKVSSFGRVKNPKGNYMTPWKTKGYLSVDFYENGKRHKRYVHFLVLSAFHGKRPEGQESRHKDGNRLNNHKSNLCWGTRSQNAKDRVNYGMDPIANHGEKNVNAKLSDNQVLEILSLRESGEKLKSIAEKFGVKEPAISRICSGKRWGHLRKEEAGEESN